MLGARIVEFPLCTQNIKLADVMTKTMTACRVFKNLIDKLNVRDSTIQFEGECWNRKYNIILFRVVLE